jgi:hypothetical protein
MQSWKGVSVSRGTLNSISALRNAPLDTLHAVGEKWADGFPNTPFVATSLCLRRPWEYKQVIIVVPSGLTEQTKSSGRWGKVRRRLVRLKQDNWKSREKAVNYASFTRLSYHITRVDEIGRQPLDEKQTQEGSRRGSWEPGSEATFGGQLNSAAQLSCLGREIGPNK